MGGDGRLLVSGNALILLEVNNGITRLFYLLSGNIRYPDLWTLLPPSSSLYKKGGNQLLPSSSYSCLIIFGHTSPVPFYRTPRL
jgi:hypothetical protein